MAATSRDHPLTDHGYEPVETVHTAFDFPTFADAKRVFGILVGERAVAHLEATGDPTVGHDVLVLHERP